MENLKKKKSYDEPFGKFNVSLVLTDSKFFRVAVLFTHVFFVLEITRETIEKYAQAIQELAVDLAHKLAESMGLMDSVFQDWPCQFRINKYNFAPESVGSPGVQLHTDSGFLTILQDDENVGGLEVMDRSGAFVPVDPLPGTLLVNLGDIATVRKLYFSHMYKFFFSIDN